MIVVQNCDIVGEGSLKTQKRKRGDDDVITTRSTTRRTQINNNNFDVNLNPGGTEWMNCQEVPRK